MYLSFYHLNQHPFQISTDPRFLWLGEKHQEALALLQYGIEENKGFALLTGDVGTGKTTLIQSLLSSIGSRVRAATICDPALSQMDFFRLITRQFNIQREFHSKGEFLDLFRTFLHHVYQREQRVLLIIDEAQRLDESILEEIRLLSNIERPETKLINIFFVGQNELDDILAKPSSRAIRQRITLRYQLKPLTNPETAAYIAHRLKVAGGITGIFSEQAVARVARFTKGYPRLINILCDHALLTGFVRNARQIGAEMIDECARELAMADDAGIVRQGAPQSASQFFRHWIDRVKSAAALILATAAALGFVASFTHLTTPTAPEPPKAPSVSAAPTPIRVAIAPEPSPGSQPAAAMADGDQVPVKPDDQPKAAMGDGDKTPLVPVPPAGAAAEPVDTVPPVPQPQLPPEVSQRPRLVIYFPFRSDQIGPEAAADLNRFARVALAHPNRQVIINGYTDASGIPEYNMRLSQLRAEMVKAQLVARQVDPKRIIANGLGPVEPQEPGARLSQAGNRRVEVELAGD